MSEAARFLVVGCGLTAVMCLALYVCLNAGDVYAAWRRFTERLREF